MTMYTSYESNTYRNTPEGVGVGLGFVNLVALEFSVEDGLGW